MPADIYQKIGIGRPLAMPYNVVIVSVTPTPSVFT
jgi:hypothetical protein